ncbi:hypothetical protein [Martelella endophytica]|nr:hypothetical protein [Martelella endophytica]
MRTAVLLACLGLAATSCSTQRSAEIGAMAVPPSNYANLSCESMTSQMAEEKAHLTTLSREQDGEIVADIRAFGASLGSVEQQGAKNQEAAIAYQKGKINAIDIAMRRKGCPMPS